MPMTIIEIKILEWKKCEIILSLMIEAVSKTLVLKSASKFCSLKIIVFPYFEKKSCEIVIPRLNFKKLSSRYRNADLI